VIQSPKEYDAWTKTDLGGRTAKLPTTQNPSNLALK
jgi:hypothetical protein